MTPRAATIAVYTRHGAHSPSNRHPLECKSVREWVQEARAGWPRVPVPRDPLKAAQKVAATYGPGAMVYERIDYEELS